MSNTKTVKRYRTQRLCPWLIEDENGVWVSIEDYEVLVREIERLKHTLGSLEQINHNVLEIIVAAREGV